jgi:hypothetical protein
LALSPANVHPILEGVGAMLAVVGLCGSAAVAVAVLINRPSEEVGRWGQRGTAAGFILGIPAGFIVFALVSK